MADKRISQLIERVDIANNDVLPIVASGATTTNKVTVSTLQDWMQDNLDVGVTSVGLSMPSAFVVTNSPVTSSGNISVAGAGSVSQYIRGDGSLADFPTISGGGSSVSYYLNGSVSQGTIGGITYKEMNKVPVLGAGTDFVAIADGYLASFITDAGDPGLLQIPAGNWNFETYFSASSGGGTPSFYIELYKVDSGGTATLIASNSATPELISFGTTITPYFSALAVPTTSLAITDRIALRYYVSRSGRTITLHTENSHLCQIITTFTTGLTALNGLTAQVQNFGVGTSGTDFNITSSVSTHTFNLPTASAVNRGLLSTADWSSFNGKVPYTGAVANVDLGAYNITANAINSAGSGSTAGQINLRSDAFFSLVNGYGSIASGTTNQFNLYQTTGAGVFRGAILSLNSITASATRTYTLPDADGTLALTSSLSGYLPLTGGTLTGALNGTSASFSGNVEIGNTVGGSINSASGLGNLVVGNGGASPQGITIYTASSTYGGLNFADATSGGGAYAGYIKFDHSNDSMGFFIGNTPRLTLASTGAATFSSSVTAGGNSNSGIVIRGNGLNNTAVSSTTLWADTAPLISVGNSSTTANTAAGFQMQVGGGNAIAGVLGIAESTSQAALGLFTGGSGTVSEKVRITSSGNVGIGTVSPSWMLEVNKDTASASTGQYPVVSVNNPNASGFGALYFYQGATQKGGLEYSNGNNSLSIIANGATRMQITSAGKVIIGQSNFTYPVSIEAQSGGGQLALTRSGAYTEFYMSGSTESGTQLYIRSGGSGGVYLPAGGTSWISASDEMFKTDLEPIENGLEKVASLRSLIGRYLTDSEDKKRAFLIAQDVEKVLPEAVVKNEETGEMGVSYTEVIPLLVAAIKELKTEIDSLKNQMQ